ncbi:MAG: 4'-phosphopantetheinyl transferase superfamily protein [Bacteroidetes bacterium]|nr:4'-phosphopantetheinyl transferase superfamily protein [Bacteroidota bacterium]
MPLLKQWIPKTKSIVAIWHITENEEFFLQNEAVRQATAPSTIRHPKRRLEHIAGRYLLLHLQADFPIQDISPDVHDKPRLPDNRYHFSLSHSYPFVAAVITDDEECGIDIQVWKENIAEIAHMFLSEEEQQVCQQESSRFTLAWCAKEALYKWNGRRGIDFIGDFKLKNISERNTNDFHTLSQNDFELTIVQAELEITITAAIYNDFAFALLIKDR